LKTWNVGHRAFRNAATAFGSKSWWDSTSSIPLSPTRASNSLRTFAPSSAESGVFPTISAYRWAFDSATVPG
jgi:hypothetical protein